MEHHELDAQISKLENLTQSAGSDPRLWKDVWNLIRAIGAGFRETRYPSKTERDMVWARYQTIVEEVKATQERARVESEHNAQRIDREIDELESAVKSAERGGKQWKEIWGDFAKIRENLKGARFSSRETKDNLWSRVNSLNDRAREHHDLQRREWEKKASTSSQRKDEIVSIANTARPLSNLERMLSDMVVGPIEAIVDALTLGLLRTEIDERKQELLHCSKQMQTAWELFSRYKDEILGKDKHEAFTTLREVQGQLDAAWESWKRAQAEFHERNHRAYEERKEGFRARVRENIQKLDDRLEKLYGVLQHKENHLSELRDKRDTAWNDDFRERVEGWIDEEERAVDDIQRKIDEIEGWREEERGKLG